jgi:hypothetical protein
VFFIKMIDVVAVPIARVHVPGKRDDAVGFAVRQWWIDWLVRYPGQRQCCAASYKEKDYNFDKNIVCYELIH